MLAPFLSNSHVDQVFAQPICNAKSEVKTATKAQKLVLPNLHLQSTAMLQHIDFSKRIRN